jgi:UDP-N-acetylglucosamine 2-epimerase (non-hydrolysing)
LIVTVRNRAVKRIVVAFGTRPEAIKMAPVIHALRQSPGIEPRVVVTAQHRHMLDQALDLFQIAPDLDLDLMRPGQGLDPLFASILTGMADMLQQQRPDLVLVHGDTTTTLATALASFHARIPLGHVEAGLRTGNMQAPWPEEANRRLVAPLARINFAPTDQARQNLLAEGIDKAAIHVTGNTVIDALLWATALLKADPQKRNACASQLPPLQAGRHLVLVTGHRRENFGVAFERICTALRVLAERNDVQIVYPVHLNPHAREPAHRLLSGLPNVQLIEPLEYLPFALLMQQCRLVITDSGGIQEEAPALGKPVLVMREVTERPEAIRAGTARLVGTDTEAIVRTASVLLDDETAYQQMSQTRNPYGDGQAATRIARVIAEL